MLRLLARRGAAAAELAALARRAGPSGPTVWAAWLAELENGCALCYEVSDERGWLARLRPMASPYVVALRAGTRGRRVLSRFACLRRHRGGFIVESPLAYARVELSARAVPRLAPLLGGRGAVATGRTADPLVALLDAAGLLTGLASGGRAAEDRNPVLRTWEFADLLFHARSRLGRHDTPTGATFEFLGRLEPLPAVKPAMGGAIKLPRPDLRRLSTRDPPLTQVLEQRRSVREPATPLTLAQLGEFLFRVARVRRRRRASARLPYETTSRPYPSGGACYPLELYLAVSECRGLGRGLYHYEPLRHRLEPIEGGAAQVDPLLRDTRHSFGSGVTPVLVMITARFARVTWKYRSMAYSVVLKDVGVLMQTMYLAATAMGLAPCAVGCGDAERSARALGTAFTAESSVGEFLLGGSPRGTGRVRR
jgi:SagB-type dehydrogenase family enzyme